jgi:hypothetical protein
VSYGGSSKGLSPYSSSSLLLVLVLEIQSLRTNFWKSLRSENENENEDEDDSLRLPENPEREFILRDALRIVIRHSDFVIFPASP